MEEKNCFVKLLDGREFLVDRIEGKWIVTSGGTRFRRSDGAVLEIFYKSCEEKRKRRTKKPKDE